MKRSREQDEQPEPRDRNGEAGSSDDDREHLRAKIVETDSTDCANTAMTCLLHNEKMTFSSYDEYESHYTNAHRNRCLECKANFPSPQILSVHIEDCHDPLAALKRESGEHTYSCFVEGCERKCATPDKRRLHLIDKHMFPRNFFFAVAREGIDGRRSLLEEGRRHRRKLSLAAKKDALRKPSGVEGGRSTEEAGNNRDGALGAEPGAASPGLEPVGGKAGDVGADAEVDHLAGVLAALKFVPPSVRFGRGGRAGFSRT